MRRRSQRLLITTIAALGLSASSVAGVTGADADDAGSLCDAIGVEALNGLSELRFAEPSFGSADVCAFEQAPEQEGPHNLFVTRMEPPFGLTIADILTELRDERGGDVEEIEVDGRAAYIDTSTPDSVNVVVEAGDELISVVADIAGSAEAGDVEPTDFARAVASLVVAESAPEDVPDESAGDASGADVAAPGPPTVEGIEWRVAREWDGARIAEEEVPVERELWERLLAAADAEFADASLSEHIGEDAESGERLGTYGAWRVAGADPTRLVAVAVDYIAELTGEEDFVAEPVTIGGREVTAVVLGGEVLGYLYGAGETLYQLELPEAAAAGVLRELE